MDVKDGINFSEIKGLRSVKDKEIKKYKREMDEKTIPTIVDNIEKRRSAAAKNRYKQLKCYSFKGT